ncbi:hypothetical protein H0O02_04280 [Candidatus Micrarchaeota archaeon]|nr:hypothetical protein [Candidatus Micrarchaeota archaeon]
MGESRYTPVEIKARLKRVSVPAPPIKAAPDIRSELSSFKPPPAVRISMDGDERFLPVEIFFGKAEGDDRKFINDHDTVVSFINGFGSREMREEATQHLIDVLSLFGNEEPFSNMVKTAKALFNLKNGQIASLEFIKKIAFESRIDWKRDTLISVMPAFGSAPIIDSFLLFSEIGINTLQSSATQIVELGFRLKEEQSIEEIGRTIIGLNKKFGKHTTLGYRGAILQIAKKDKIPDEDKPGIVHAVSEKILSFDSDIKVLDFSMFLENALGTNNPREAVLGLCKSP